MPLYHIALSLDRVKCEVNLEINMHTSVFSRLSNSEYEFLLETPLIAARLR